MGKMILATVLAIALSLVGAATSHARDLHCQYTLVSSTDGTAEITIRHAEDNDVRIVVEGAPPETMYTVWVDFRDRDHNDALPPGHPLGAREVAPAFAARAGVTSGIGLDPNAFITDKHGRGVLQTNLDYDVLAPGDAPVVFQDLAKQGLNEVGGAWMRKYTVNPNTAASLQLVDPDDPTMPRLERSTARGFTIVRHPDFVSHGHTPGIGSVDHFSAFKGNFPCD